MKLFDTLTRLLTMPPHRSTSARSETSGLQGGNSYCFGTWLWFRSNDNICERSVYPRYIAIAQGYAQG